MIDIRHLIVIQSYIPVSVPLLQLHVYSITECFLQALEIQ